MAASFTTQLLTVSMITLQRQISHNLLANRREWNSEYDFVIVGGGTAGCVVAARLSENPKFSVLLIEAGGPETPITDMPSQTMINALNPLNMWAYPSTIQSRIGLGLPIASLPQIGGRITGGTGFINGLAYNRGNRRDFDGWANQFGARGWSYDEVLPYFIRAENNTDPDIVRRYPGYHGTGGPLPVSSTPNPDPILIRMRDALNQLGYPTTDINADTQFGACISQSNIDSNRIRGTTSNSYLLHVINSRPNLHIITNSEVTRILTRRSGNTGIEAYGVTFTRNNSSHTVNAKREVIVSAGALNSPRLLLLSGIGPADHLRQVNIPVVVDLPVGNNYMEHITLPVLHIVNNASDVTVTLYPQLTVRNLFEYYTRGSGPLSRFPAMLNYINSPLNNDNDWPDGILDVIFTPLGNVSAEMLSLPFPPQRRAEWTAYLAPFVANSNRIIMINMFFARPRSRGTLRLDPSDPNNKLVIDPNFYGDPQDLAVHVSIVSLIMQLIDSQPFRPLLTASALSIPGCRTCGPNIALYNCYSYVTCHVQSASVGSGHISGTCRMGSTTDPNAVLDERLRVRGVSRLRVIDASVFPQIPNANTYAAVVMVAEKGSDLIRQDNPLI